MTPADEFSETDEWPTPQGWMRHQAETGLVPPPRSTLRPNDDRTVWRDRGVRIAALETENARLMAARDNWMVTLEEFEVRAEEAADENTRLREQIGAVREQIVTHHANCADQNGDLLAGCSILSDLLNALAMS